MRMRGLCVLASLLLCDNSINAEGQRSREAEGVVEDVKDI
jgi:hypothetical protein